MSTKISKRWTVKPLATDAVRAFRGSGKKGLVKQLLKDRQKERDREKASRKYFVIDTSALFALDKKIWIEKNYNARESNRGSGRALRQRRTRRLRST
jgi:hypothetical protein